MIQISWSALISLALLILLLPLKWILCALLAALIHEMAHILVLLSLGGKINGICVNVGGAVIDAWIPSQPREIIGILAGPAGSFLLLIFYSTLPELSVCAAIQGLFNLLPIYPLDGGRIQRLFPCRSLRILFTLVLSATLLLISCHFIQYLFPQNPKHILPFAAVILFSVLRNTPCKEEQIGLQ